MKIIKYIITIIIVAFVINKPKAQVPDTAQYLIDSIQPKISYYVGKPLKVLLNDLKIKPVVFRGILPTPEKPDTIMFSTTSLVFFTIAQCEHRKSNSF